MIAYYYTSDHLGSVREMCNSSGTIVARYSYDPYGRTSLVSGSNVATFQYAGYYAHQPSGLLFTRNVKGFAGREYDSNTGRWLSRDAIGEGGGLNLYGYVADDPDNLIDSFGLSPCDAERIALKQAQLDYDMSDLNQQSAALKRAIAELMYLKARTAVQKAQAMDQIEAAKAEIATASQAKGAAAEKLLEAQIAYDLCEAASQKRKPWVCPIPWRIIMWPAGLVPLFVPRDVLPSDPNHPPMA